MIELHDLVKGYPTKAGYHVVLDRISATFPSGQNVGIIGENGAGKSTLLRIIGGSEVSDSGRVVREGRVSWPLGFAGGFHGTLTGEENCRFVARVHDADADEVIDFARSFADIGEYFYMPVKTYSSGMRGRLAFGLSMAIDFDTYLVDEVTLVGDTRFQEKCRREFRARSAYASILMVSHDLATIREYCQRCALVRNAGIEFFDSVDEAERAYSGEHG